MEASRIWKNIPMKMIYADFINEVSNVSFEIIFAEAILLINLC
jgi:hypothetical protein